MFCKQQVAQLRDFVEPIRERGGQLLAIGNGSAKQAKAFHEEQEMAFPLLTDPSLRTYRAAGMKSGLARTFGISSALRGLSALRGGFLQGRTKGAALQQGGALVIAPDGTELFRFVSEEAGQHPDPQDLVDALGTSPPRKRG